MSVPRSSLTVLLASAGLSGTVAAQLAIPTAVIPPGNDPRTGLPWEGPGPYPRVVTSANFNVSIPAGSVLNGNNDNGDQALRVYPIRSGPFPYTWTSGWTNEGDIDVNIAPGQPNNPNAYPPDQFIRLRDGRDPASGVNDGGGLRTYAWSVNQYHGVMMTSVRANGRNNQDTVFGVPVGTLYGLTNVSADTFRSGRAYSMLDGRHRDGGGSVYLSMHYAGTPGNQEMSLDCAAGWFPFAQGWVGGYLQPIPGDNNDALYLTGEGQVACTPALPTSIVTWNTVDTTSAQVFVSLPEVNSATDGVMLATPYQDGNNPDYVVASPSGGGWNLTYRRTSYTSESEVQPWFVSRFVFVYVPFSAANALAARIDGATGATLAGTGAYSVQRLGTGRYRLSITGKTDLDGSVMLQSAGADPESPSRGQRAFFSYQPQPDGSFEVQARRLIVGDPGNAFFEDAELVDADFAFVWLDHTSPIALCPVDFNRDGFVDFFDYDAFVGCFETGNCPFARTADANLDGFVDFFDYDQFVGGFESGC